MYRTKPTKKEKERKIRLPNGKIIKRIPKVHRVGNFVMLTIRYNNAEYHIGDGSEYLHGEPDIYDLGNKI